MADNEEEPPSRSSPRLPSSETRIALEETKELLRSVLDSTPTAIISTDREGRVVFAGKSPRTNVRPIGALAWELAAPEHRARARAAFDAVLATGTLQTYEAEDTRGYSWRVQAGPRFEHGAVVGVTFIGTDITEHRTLETRLAIADRMASIGTLAAGVAHEVNNPLTYVLANVASVAREAESRGDLSMKERLDAALEGIERIRSVVSDLNTFSHVDADRRQVLDVAPVIDAAVRLAQAETRYRARIVRDFQAIPPVLASDGRLGQVFLNLIVNAAQSLPEGAADRNEITLRTYTSEAGQAVIEVADTGVGIAPALLRRIFEPFVTTKPRGEGTGLGLYICRNVVTSLGGELTVCSTVGVGTRFRVTLPPADVAAITVPPITVDRPRRELRHLRILVIEDEPAITDVIVDSLAGHSVVVTHSGREALEHLAASEFDVVFCDLMMPQVTGMDVYETVRAQGKGVERRFVFLTAGPFTARAQRFVATIPNRVLHKPFTAEDVLDALPSGELCSPSAVAR